ncbi:MAG: amidohydrolase family protein, partial [Clostridia bacterium]|nr:amidohydrolase family protein [Clostridia bacterium]
MKSSIKVIKNAKIILENGVLDDGIIVINGEIISNVGKFGEIDIPCDAEIIDANGDYVGPGFVDIHVHGGLNFGTYIDPDKATNFFLSHGETTILATPYYAMNFDEFIDAIKVVKDNMKTNKTIKGIYFEGPYTNPNYGCKADLNPWRNDIPSEIYQKLVDYAGDLAKVWTIAPERNDLLPFLKYAKKVNPNVKFSLGHSQATPSQVEDLKEYKPTIMVHTFNATGRVGDKGGIRGVGPDEYALLNDDVYCELISDSCAIHVPKELQRLLLKIKGYEKVILITDSMHSDENTQVPEKYKDIKDLNFDHNGGLAGSKMTLDYACKNIMDHTGVSIDKAFYMASTAPA